MLLRAACPTLNRVPPPLLTAALGALPLALPLCPFGAALPLALLVGLLLAGAGLARDGHPTLLRLAALWNLSLLLQALTGPLPAVGGELPARLGLAAPLLLAWGWAAWTGRRPR